MGGGLCGWAIRIGSMGCTADRIDCATRGLDLVNFFRALGRSIRLAGMFVVAGTELAVKRPRTREERADWLHRFCARAMKGMGIEVSVSGAFPEQGAVISNHLSYLDI